MDSFLHGAKRISLTLQTTGYCRSIQDKGSYSAKELVLLSYGSLITQIKEDASMTSCSQATFWKRYLKKDAN